MSDRRVDFLNDTIQAHRYALSLNQENADILFNTAQVLTTAADVAQESKDPEAQREAVDLLKEAAELFSSCLARQELEFTESQARADTITTEEESAMEESDSLLDPVEEWATVMAPITASDLVETTLAQLSTLATLISMSFSISGTDSNEFKAFADVGTALIQQKLPQYISRIPEISSAQDKPTGPFLSLSDAEPTLHMEDSSQPSNPKAEASGEAAITTGIFTAALAEAEYRAQLCTTRTYHDRINSVFEPLQTQITTSQSTALLLAYADALVSFASAVSEMLLPSDNPAVDEPEAEVQSMCWKALSKAQDILSDAIKTFTSSSSANANADLPTRASVFLTRGDIELLRRQLALSPKASPAIAGSSSALLRNAGVYYRAAEGYAKTGNDQDEDEEVEASIKAAVVKILEGDANAINNLNALVTSSRGRQLAAAAKATDMIDEGLLGDEDRLKLNDVIATE